MRSRVPMGLYRAFFFLFSLSLSLSLFRSSIARDTLKGLVRGSLLPFESESCREKKKKRFLFFSHRFSFDDSFPSFRSSLLFSRHDENFEKVNGKWGKLGAMQNVSIFAIRESKYSWSEQGLLRVGLVIANFGEEEGMELGLFSRDESTLNACKTEEGIVITVEEKLLKRVHLLRSTWTPSWIIETRSNFYRTNILEDVVVFFNTDKRFLQLDTDREERSKRFLSRSLSQTSILKIVKNVRESGR